MDCCVPQLLLFAGHPLLGPASENRRLRVGVAPTNTRAKNTRGEGEQGFVCQRATAAGRVSKHRS
jgi:hypothetical protein